MLETQPFILALMLDPSCIDVGAVTAHEAELGWRWHEGLVLGVGVVGARRGFHGVGVAEVRRHGRGCSRLRLHGENEGERKKGATHLRGV